MPLSYRACVRQYRRLRRAGPDRFAFSRERYSRITPDMAEHAEALMAFHAGQAHAFFYICACVDLAPAGPAAASVSGLCERIGGMLWDRAATHGLLFEGAPRYTRAQSWALATAMVRSFEATLQARALAFMTVSSRGDSPVHRLGDDVLRAIGRCALEPLSLIRDEQS